MKPGKGCREAHRPGRFLLRKLPLWISGLFRISDFELPISRATGNRVVASSRLAFTLVEVVISGALMAMILVTAYLCFSAAISSQKLIEPQIEILQNARVAMALMTADLRGACPLSKDFELLGTHRMLGNMPGDSMDFATHNYTPSRLREGDPAASGSRLRMGGAGGSLRPPGAVGSGRRRLCRGARAAGTGRHHRAAGMRPSAPVALRAAPASHSGNAPLHIDSGRGNGSRMAG